VKYPKKTLSRSFFGSTSYYESKPLASSLSDEQLMIRYQDSDEAAFEEIYARYGKKIYAFLMRRLGQPDDCAELFQETFLHLHRGRSSYKPEMAFKTWLYTIANNLVRDNLRIKMRSKSARATEGVENTIERAIPDGNYKLQSFHHLHARSCIDPALFISSNPCCCHWSYVSQANSKGRETASRRFWSAIF
jgi:RNA polymerase sigma factor (sigma-70 family)